MGTDPFVNPYHENDEDASGKPLIGPGGLWAGGGLVLNPDREAGPIRVHVHARVEIGVVLSGEEQIHYANHTLSCRRGDVWLCSSWEPHGYRYARTVLESVVLRFMPEFIGEELLGEVPWLILFAAPPASRPRVSSEPLRARVLSLGWSMGRERWEKPPSWESVVRFELLCLLTELCRAWRAPSELESPGPPRVNDLAQIMPALNLVHAGACRRIGAAEAAAACGMSKSSFRGAFSRTMQMTYRQFEQRARLSFAAHQVLNTGRTVEAIAVESGFVDESHLRRCFLAQYGCTPAQYRRRLGAPAARAGE